ncbi:sulfurtransferase [Halobacterium wangiae]|uniref:sulfurtransferase n=1 Tax=Halobacterium wangiae TaxID=2902623 RepID=UPI001E422C34|nr:sulfurtransferase [Halobacterium wangiae]
MNDWVVTTGWLAGRLADEAGEDGGRVRLVDVRDAWEYDGIGHVPGAVNVPFDEFRSTDGAAGMMPDRGDWEALLSAAGVAPEDTLVAYDDTHGVFAARFLLTALYFGHEDLRLLDGDYSAWIRDHEATTEVPDVDETDYRAGDAPAGVFVDDETVLAAIDDPDAVLVDTREPWEYEEGHVPGAVNLDWKEVVDAESRGLKPREEVAELLESRGVTAEKRVVLYCNTARRISHTFVVLGWLGYPDVAFYEGSLTEWTERGHPLE